LTNGEAPLLMLPPVLPVAPPVAAPAAAVVAQPAMEPAPGPSRIEPPPVSQLPAHLPIGPFTNESTHLPAVPPLEVMPLKSTSAVSTPLPIEMAPIIRSSVVSARVNTPMTDSLPPLPPPNTTYFVNYSPKNTMLRVGGELSPVQPDSTTASLSRRRSTSSSGSDVARTIHVSDPSLCPRKDTQKPGTVFFEPTIPTTSDPTQEPAAEALTDCLAQYGIGKPEVSNLSGRSAFSVPQVRDRPMDLRTPATLMTDARNETSKIHEDFWMLPPSQPTYFQHIQHFRSCGYSTSPTPSTSSENLCPSPPPPTLTPEVYPLPTCLSRVRTQSQDSEPSPRQDHLPIKKRIMDRAAVTYPSHAQSHHLSIVPFVKDEDTIGITCFERGLRYYSNNLRDPVEVEKFLADVRTMTMKNVKKNATRQVQAQAALPEAIESTHVPAIESTPTPYVPVITPTPIQFSISSTRYSYIPLTERISPSPTPATSIPSITPTAPTAPRRGSSKSRNRRR